MRALILLSALILTATSATAQDSDGAVPDDSIPAPVILSVEPFDVLDGTGQSAVMITFEAVAGATKYRIWRETEVTVEVDESGALIPLDVPTLRFIPWALADAIPGENPVRVVVATLDGRLGRWGVSAQVLRDGATHLSPISIFDPPTAVLQTGWGHIKRQIH